MKRISALAACLVALGCSSSDDGHDTLQAAIDALTDRVTNAETAQNGHGGRLDALETAIAEPASVEAANVAFGDTTVQAALQKTEAGLATTIADLAATDQAQITTVSALEAAVARIDALEATVETLENKVSELEATAQQNATDATAAAESAAEANAAVADLAGKVDPDQVGCPEGMLELDGLCIDSVPEVHNFKTAAGLCRDKGMRLCTPQDYSSMCAFFPQSFSDPTPELTADLTGTHEAHAISVCTIAGVVNTSQSHPTRCCARKADLVYADECP